MVVQDLKGQRREVLSVHSVAAFVLGVRMFVSLYERLNLGALPAGYRSDGVFVNVDTNQYVSVQALVYGLCSQMIERTNLITTNENAVSFHGVGMGSVSGGLDTSWPLFLKTAEGQVYSQWSQDGVLKYIFDHIGVTNRFFVEFGFDQNAYTFGANTHMLFEQGWKGLLMDGGHENATINLHKEMISIDNIVELFEKYKVPQEPDYVSVDLDSCDIWVMKKIATAYRPRVMTIEYNSNFPAGATVAWPPTCSERWKGDKVYGSSVGAIFMAAEDVGYTVVHGIEVADLFLIRNDVLFGRSMDNGVKVYSQSTIERWITNAPLHPDPVDGSRYELFVEYDAYARKGKSVKDAQREAFKYIQEHTSLIHS